MVGLVIVAHSRHLAEGVGELVEQLTQGKVPLALAGGIDDPKQPIGTDAFRVAEAIQEVDGPDGVVVLVDLGSAVLSAEMALEMLPEETRRRVRLLAAPLVEGAVAAAVQAAAGGDLEQVAREARQALRYKQVAGEGPSEQEEEGRREEAPPSDAVRAKVRVPNPLGLHARPAARLIALAQSLGGVVWLRRGSPESPWVPLESLNRLLALRVRQGEEVEIAVSGVEALEAQRMVSRLVAAIAQGLGDALEPAAPREAQPAPTNPITLKETLPAGVLQGVPVAEGVAVGPVWLLRPRWPQMAATQGADPDKEWQRLERAIALARRELQMLQAEMSRRAGASAGAIFAAHLLWLEDPETLQQVRDKVFRDRLSAEAAWAQVWQALVADYRRAEEEWLRWRAADVEDVALRVLGHLLAQDLTWALPDQPAILVTEELTPSEAARLDPERILGLVTALGGATSHAAILARAMGIPAVVGVGPAVLEIPEGQTIALDGAAGRVWVALSEEERERLLRRREAWLARREAALALARQPGTMADGHRVHVEANIFGAADARAALRFGAEGVGLMRTEFLFVNRDTPPDEEEQVAVYREVFRLLGKRPVVIRTLDIGGDKPVSYLQVGEEANPFLGLRGIRLTLAQPALFRTQLRAILRAGVGHRVRVMFPMVAEVAEVRQAKALLREVCQELNEEGRVCAWPEVGIMIEVPSAALLAARLAGEVDFFSIGTNDLSQYTLAADRTHPQVASLADAFHPAVLRLIRQVTQAARRRRVPVAVCGEIAGDPLAAIVLVGLGVQELSMNPPQIPEVKVRLRSVSLTEAQKAARAALRCASAAEVKALLKRRFGGG